MNWHQTTLLPIGPVMTTNCYKDEYTLIELQGGYMVVFELLVSL